MKKAFPNTKDSSAFSLVEILVSSAVLALILVIISSITSRVQQIYHRTQSKFEQFREARVAFEAISRQISLATLNTYWDYDDPSNPTRYMRQSQLRFRCGQAAVLLPTSILSNTHAIFFQVPSGFTAEKSGSSFKYDGMGTMLNTWGYFIEFGSDINLRPDVVKNIATRNRFRLFEMREPAENLSVYAYTSGNPTYAGSDWFQDPLGRTNRSAYVLAENIIALIFIPMDPELASLSSDYSYDSSPNSNASTQRICEHQLPPNVQVTMVGIDEASARRLDTGATPPDLGLSGLFLSVGDVVNPENPGYAKDLNILRDRLTKQKINFRIFTTSISLKGAKWNRN